MSRITINSPARFKFRSDTAANWEENNPVLLSGEIGITTDGAQTQKIKVGDGLTVWTELPYYGNISAEFAEMVKKAESSAENVERLANDAAGSAVSAAESYIDAQEAASNAKQSEEKASQAYEDFLNQLGTDVPTLVGGKIPMSQIPATATQEIYTVTSEDELTSLTAQRGDLAELIEEVDGEQTITKTWQCLGDSTSRESWVVWGTSYAVSAGNASTAANAENANMINNHRLVEISAEEFETAVKDENTYYLVY